MNVTAVPRAGAIVREIAQSHGGDAALASGSGGSGTLVKITLPMAA